MRHAISWFEVLTNKLDRAQAIYETLFGKPLRNGDMGPAKGAAFPCDKKAGGALAYLDTNRGRLHALV